MKLNIAQIVGLNTDQRAAQVISTTGDQDNAFMAVVKLSCDDAFSKGRVGLSELSDFYFEADGAPAEKIKATYEEASQKFSSEGEFDLVLAVLSGKILYLQATGQVEVYLKREDKLSSLLGVGSAGQLISGFLQPGDKLLLGTKSLTTFLGEELDKSLDLTSKLWEEEMSAKMQVPELGDLGLAGLFVEVLSEEQAIPTLSAQDQEQETSGPYQPTTKLRTNIFSRLSAIKDRIQWARFFPKSGRGRLILALVLIMIIGLGVGFKYKTSKDAARQLLFNQLVEAAKEDFNAAKGLAGLNPGEAKNKLEVAKDKVNKAIALKPKDQGAQNLKKQIEQESSSILQQFTTSDFPLFLDLDLIKKDFKAKIFSLSADKILLLDPSTSTLVVIDIAKKSHQILGGVQTLGSATHASLNGALAFTYSKDKGVIRVDITNQKQVTVAKADKDWGDILDLYAFASNVYLLDTTKNQIWKYLPTSEGYSDKREYLTKDTKVDFTGALRMQIESSIYVLKSGGEILRFTRGVKDHFSLGGLDKGVKDPKSLFVSSDTDNLYLLDSGNSRLLVLTKTGSYKGQYQGGKFASASDLVVDEKGKKVYLLEGNKIYQMDLK